MGSAVGEWEEGREGTPGRTPGWEEGYPSTDTWHVLCVQTARNKTRSPSFIPGHLPKAVLLASFSRWSAGHLRGIPVAFTFIPMLRGQGHHTSALPTVDAPQCMCPKQSQKCELLKVLKLLGF